MKIAVIGGGVSGLAAASRLAANGHQVDLYEKNQQNRWQDESDQARWIYI
ncbi:squalene synthase [Staphylococcus gallinarum]|uniref:Squalene synthase n=1 Tax=Staphylococcus gallinarum TaxID=1293 RepID=A0A380FCF4_STAGA|nr:squalene synthase [Staphylococcus gallinarum]